MVRTVKVSIKLAILQSAKCSYLVMIPRVHTSDCHSVLLYMCVLSSFLLCDRFCFLFESFSMKTNLFYFTQEFWL